MPTPIDQTLANKFRQAQTAFADEWKLGTFDWLKENAIGTVVTLDIAEKNLDSAWRDAKSDPNKMMAFDIALGMWKAAHVAALNEFKARSGA